MRNDTFLFIVGILVFLTPFLGVPESWKTLLLFVLGSCVLLSAFLHRLVSRKLEKVERDEVFTESEPTVQESVES